MSEPVSGRDMPDRRSAESVGLVIPCYNYGAYLAEAIDSALAQTVKFDQIVVVDDGSTDNTAEVAAAYAPTVTYLHVPNSGVSAARNRGAGILSTKYVIFLDADDRMHPEFVERCLDVMGGAEDSFVYTDMQFFGTTSERFRAGEYSVSRLAHSNFIHPASMFPLRLVEEYPYRETLRFGLEDWDLYLSLAEHGHHGRYLPEAVFLYRQHDRGITRNLREHPFGLARLRLQLARDHRGLYTTRSRAAYLVSVGRLLILDLALGERIVRNIRTPGRLNRLRMKGSKLLGRSPSSQAHP